MERKSKFLILKLILTILIINLIFILACLMMVFKPFLKQNHCVENFGNYKNNYLTVCDEVIKISKTNNWSFDKGEYYFINKVNKNKDREVFYCYEKSTRPYKEYPLIDLSNELKNSYKKIFESFPDESSYDFDFICFSKNRISFHSESGNYAIVYSFDDTKPTFLCDPNVKNNVTGKKIEKNWYHIWSK